ncbi:MAG: tetratricopeptide repeat protein [Planctomycetes bacterium]|nr:tetratricopeptide repeat protein [Planctomycetota bacterium]
MKARGGARLDGPAPRGRPILLGALAVAAVAAAIAAGLFLSREGPRRVTEEELEAPALVGTIPWPPVRREAQGAFQGALEALSRAGILYRQGDLNGADAAVVSAVGALERCGALVPALGAHHVQTVASAMSRHDFIEAERRALRWLEKLPGDFDHQFLLGKARYQLRRWAQAAESFRAALRVRPASADAMRWLSQTCAQMGAQEEAVIMARTTLDAVGFPDEALWDHPLAPLVLRNAIMVLHRFHEYELLEPVARAYLARHPGASEAAMSLGVALAQLGKYAEAEPLLRAARADPENAENSDEISFSLGLALSKGGRHKEAAAAFAELLARNPFHAKAYHQLGLALHRLGRPEQAEAMASKARELAPSEREMRREVELRGSGQPGRAAAARSLGHALRGELAEAEQALRAPELREDPYAVFALADLYRDALRLADMERVLAHAAALPRIARVEVEGRRAIGRAHRGETEAAAADLRALAAAGASTYWQLELARLLLEAGAPAEAATALEPLRQDDSDREVSFLLGRALLEAREPARALAMLRSISTGDTRWDDWEGPAWLARAILEAGAASGAELGEAAALLEGVPAQDRASAAWLRARALLLTARAAPAEDLARAREALERFEALEPRVQTARRKIAASPWPASGPLHLELGGLHRARGQGRLAVRHARLALLAAPGSPEALRALADWLDAEGDGFFRLHALRELARAQPRDAAIQEAIRAIEARWLAP